MLVLLACDVVIHIRLVGIILVFVLFNYSTEHSGRAYILIAATNDGFNTSMFCYVLDWIGHLLLRRCEYQCSYCWSCHSYVPDKDSFGIGEESYRHNVLNREAHATGSILVGGNSN